MGKIKVLDENMINMIAAGEVIERPASVVKELIENSIDAGATKITVSIEDGGKKLISISDDGCGMDSDDMALAFCAHATSKIKTSDDLMNISTMGFRGEALASIGSIAQVTVTSKTADSIEAYRVDVDCGEISDARPCSASVGTTIEVRNIFYKLPGRRKFLKTGNTEFTHVSEQFKRVALAKGGVAMVLRHNGREVYRLDAAMGLGQRIAVLFPSDICQGLFEICSSEKNLEVHGLIGSPENGRANSKYQYVFLNGRFIRDKFIMHAIKESYRGMISPDKFPAIFMFCQMPAENFDVNVHPTKIEVRFDNSNLVHSQVLGVIRQKLLSLDLDVSGKFDGGDDSMNVAGSVTDAMKGFFDSHGRGGGGASQNRFDFTNIKRGSDSAAMGRRESFYDSEPEQSADFLPSGGSADFVQIHDSYILKATDDGFMIIDQHALHERIIYESLCRRLEETDSLQSQRLLVPETFEATAEQIDIARNNIPLFKKLGIEICEFGPGVLAIQAFASLLDKVNAADFVIEMLDMLADNPGLGKPEVLLHKVLDMTACKAAVKAGQRLSDAEIRQLLSDKQAVERASRCPHGRPTTVKMTIAQLDKQFGRT